MSLAVGIGVARSLEYQCAPLVVRLKWPNDIHVSGGKAAGILLETTPQATGQVVVGVGVNVAKSPDLGDDPASSSVRSLSSAVGHEVKRYELLAPVVASILSTIAEVDRFADDLVAEFRTRCLLTGQRISFQDGGRSCEGACQGVSDDGELLVETDSGLRQLQSGEASLVRAQSPG
jgi:BirA family biotin operon repressor/biotin-[acetyl-CoA-carboxylase] ligase